MLNWKIMKTENYCSLFLLHLKKKKKKKLLKGAIQIIRDTLGGRGGLAKMSQDNFDWEFH